MKKLWKFLIVASFGFSFFGCAKKEQTTTKKVTTTKQQKKITIKYKIDEGVILDNKDDVEITLGENFTLGVPKKEGFTFTGWYYLDGSNNVFITDGLGASLDAFEEDFSKEVLEVSPNWTVEIERITFNTTGGSIVNDQMIEYNTCASRPTEDPTKDGHTFKDWYTEAEGGELFDFENTQLTSNTTIYAQWTVNKYSFNYSTYDDTIIAVSSTVPAGEVEYGTEITLEATELQGHTFLWWENLAGKDRSYNKKFTFKMPAYEVNYQAAYTSYYVTVLKNISSAGSVSDYNYTPIIYNSTVTITATPNTGYKFVEWQLNGEYYSNQASFEYTVNKAYSTFKAIFAINTYDVTVKSTNVSYGTLSKSYDNAEVEYGTYIRVSASSTNTKRYTFAGWFTSPTAITAYSTSSTLSFNVTSNAYYEARFNVNEYTITYNMDGGTNNSSNPKKIYGTTILPITLQAPTKDGYEFAGWKEGSISVSGITEYSNHTLTATWTPCSYSVKFKVVLHSGYSYGSATVKIGTGSSYTVNESTSQTLSVLYGEKITINLSAYLGRDYSSDPVKFGTGSTPTSSVNGTINNGNTLFEAYYSYTTGGTIFIDFSEYNSNEDLQYFNFISWGTSCIIISGKDNVSNVTSLTIPSYVKEIREDAFSKFYNLETLNVPFIGLYRANDLKEEAYNHLGYWFKTKVSGQESKYIATDAVYGSDSTDVFKAYFPKSLNTLILNQNYTGAYKRFFAYCCSFKIGGIAPNIKRVGYDYETPEQVIIEKYSFSGMSNLEEFNCLVNLYKINDGISYFGNIVGEYAFQHTGLKGVSFVKTENVDLVYFDRFAFNACKSLTYVYLKSGVQVKGYVFANCSNLDIIDGVKKSGICMTPGVYLDEYVFAYTPCTMIKYNGEISDWNADYSNRHSSWRTGSSIVGYYELYDVNGPWQGGAIIL